MGGWEVGGETSTSEPIQEPSPENQVRKGGESRFSTGLSGSVSEEHQNHEAVEVGAWDSGLVFPPRRKSDGT